MSKSNKIKTIQRKELYSIAKKYIDISELFPKSKINARKLSDYQAKKIARELHKLERMAGGWDYLQRDFQPVRRTKAAREYMDRAGINQAARGVIINQKGPDITGVRFANGMLLYKRAKIDTATYPIDATSEENVRASIREIALAITNPENYASLHTPGGKIVNAYATRRGRTRLYEDFPTPQNEMDELLEEAAVNLYNKYSMLASAGAIRENGRRAAHPSRWGMAVRIERK